MSSRRLGVPAASGYYVSPQTSPYGLGMPIALAGSPSQATLQLPGDPMTGYYLPYYSPNGNLIQLPMVGQQPTINWIQNLQGRGSFRMMDILHPAVRLAGGAHIYYDLRDFPDQARVIGANRQVAELPESLLSNPLTNPPLASIKVVSKLFPWEIEVQSPGSNIPVTIADLVNALHESLQEHVAPSEWWIVGDREREKCQKQYQINLADSTKLFSKERKKGDVIRRVDWLLENFVVLGLERDDAWISTRVPKKEDRERTWVLVTGAINRRNL